MKTKWLLNGLCSSNALFEVLETQAQLASDGLQVNVLPPGVPVIYSMGGSPEPLLRGR
jgi:hypothetical protein